MVKFRRILLNVWELMVVIFISLFVIGSSGQCQSMNMTMEECVDLALKNNPDVGIAEEGFRKAGDNLLYNYGRVLPQLSVDFYTGHRFYGPSTVQYDSQGRPIMSSGFDYEDYSLRIMSDVVVFDGGSNINNIRAAIKDRDASRYELDYRKDLITAMVIRGYYDLVRNRMLLNVQRESLIQAKKSLQRSETLLEVGTATRADVLKARVRYSNKKLDLIKAKNAVEIAQGELLTIMGMEWETEIEVDTTLIIDMIEPDTDGEIEFAVAHRPDLKSLKYGLQSAGCKINAAKGGYLPSVGASFGYYWNDREMAENLNFFKEEYSWSVTGYISFNVFDRFITTSSVGTAKADRRIAEYNLEKARLEVAKEIKELVFSIREAKERIIVATETVDQATEDLRLAEERYRVGSGTMLETIDAQVGLTQAKSDIIDAKCDYLIAVADLKRATGRDVCR
jgi:outer membrane protein